MSRVGKLPVPIPEGVDVRWKKPVISVKGPGGEYRLEVKPPADVKIEDSAIKVTRPDDTRPNRAAQGLYRSLINNMVVGVTKGYEKRLEIVGVGYRAEVEGRALKLSVGYAFPKIFEIPEGITVNVEKDLIVVRGSDKQKVGDAAARIRAYRPPEPYKGKGIRYQGEYVKIKAGKTAVGQTE
jgi:large subunit ribosomal protein L6